MDDCVLTGKHREKYEKKLQEIKKFMHCFGAFQRTKLSGFKINFLLL